MAPVYVSICKEGTGKRIGEIIHEQGLSVKDIQEGMGFESPQAVYKWLSGKSLPSLDNILILSRLLNTSIEDILVVSGDIFNISPLCADPFLFSANAVLMPGEKIDIIRVVFGYKTDTLFGTVKSPLRRGETYENLGNQFQPYRGN